MLNLKKIYFPEKLSDFKKVFKKSSYVMSGFTYSFKSVEKNNDISEIIVVDQLPLRYIKEKGEYICVGSLSTFDDLENNQLCKKYFGGFISYAASRCSSQLIRNMATIGGNIYHMNSFNIMPIVIKTLDAKIKVYDFKKEFLVSSNDFFNLKKPFFIIEIIFPLKYKNSVFYFEKISNTYSSWQSYITFSFRGYIDKEIIKDIKLVFGGISAIPYNDSETEKSILNKKLDSKIIDEFAKKYSENIYNINPSHKYSEYRRDVSYNVIKEFLNTLKRRSYANS